METTRHFIGLLIITASILMFFTNYGLAGVFAVSFSQNGSPADSPVVDYDTEIVKEKSEARKEKDSHFNGLGAPGFGAPGKNRPITELPLEVEPLPLINHWFVGLSSLPVVESDFIILGEIVAREAHLSGDGTGIYSEITVRIDEVFKSGLAAVTPGSSLSVNRLGGTVRFASGRIQKYTILRQGTLRQNSQYVLFLRKTAEGDSMVVTGYELAAGHVTPLDGEDVNDPRSDLPFAKYRGVEQAAFLQELRETIANSSNRGATL